MPIGGLSFGTLSTANIYERAQQWTRTTTTTTNDKNKIHSTSKHKHLSIRCTYQRKQPILCHFFLIVCVSQRVYGGEEKLWLNRSSSTLNQAQSMKSTMCTEREEDIVTSMMFKRLRVHCSQYQFYQHCISQSLHVQCFYTTFNRIDITKSPEIFSPLIFSKLTNYFVSNFQRKLMIIWSCNQTSELWTEISSASKHFLQHETSNTLHWNNRNEFLIECGCFPLIENYIDIISNSEIEFISI